MVLDEDPAQFLMCLGRAEQHAVRNDDRSASARLEQLEEQRQEQQLSLLGPDDTLQILGRALVVQAARKRRVGQDQRVELLLPT